MEEKLIINTIFEIEVNILPLFTKVKKHNSCFSIYKHKVISTKLYVTFAEENNSKLVKLTSQNEIADHSDCLKHQDHQVSIIY